MQPRGPDGEGLWQEGGVALGHRRLAILDLDARAAQPMQSADGRYLIVFNGEIYNFRDLRRELEREGHAFRTESDTEVLLALFARDGEAMLDKLHGMFAFVVWDRQARRAFAARDPYGIKPLYVAKTGNGIMLASQVKALLASGQVAHDPDPEGQAGFWLLGSVPEPRTWYRDIQAVPAGHFAWIAEGAVQRMVCWHDIGQVWRNAESMGERDDASVVASVRAALRESVARHLVADVPVGVFLSGGIDSGALAGLMVEAGTRDLQGVTIAYDEFAGSHQDEAPAAAALARHYGIRHHVRRVTREEFLADLPRILASMDQPSIDGINTWYASKAVAELGLKVVVSGVGGDELFQGYRSFRQLPALVSRWRKLSSIPGALALGRLAGALHARRTGNARWRHAADWLRSLEGAYLLSRGLFAPDAFPTEADTAVLAKGFDPVAHVVAMTGSLPADRRLALGQIESMTYLRNQLLRDSDWASMAHSVELRTPLVDAHLLTQLQPLLPSFTRFPGKSLLAQAPEKPLPEAIRQRRKTGFGIPVSRWLAEGGIAANDGSRSWARQVARAWSQPRKMSA
ncbi:asparagine synthase (glutamine-hydrolyzing) [Thermomonas alba]|uniref:asparagine synthase (glutamine-hydrolyzing) n=1 Tax=Thermomonas alba TaxID=2888525 RepID=UPI001F03F1EB|nr:asparagine synthase (glutamine-hydrolyzing) [Thermomonas alba]